MFKKPVKSRGRSILALRFCVLAVLGGSFCQGAEQTKDPNAPSDGWDPARYISLDEIKPGMEAYCLTEYGVDGVEKFGLKVIDIVRDFEPGRDIILVQGTDERFVHTGPVAGCSGSPVYIDGRMAGALAFAWTYSKDPLYGATAIADMLRVGRGRADEPASGGPAFSFDYSKPIDLAEIDRQISTPRPSQKNRFGGVRGGLRAVEYCGQAFRLHGCSRNRRQFRAGCRRRLRRCRCRKGTGPWGMSCRAACQRRYDNGCLWDRYGSSRWDGIWFRPSLHGLRSYRPAYGNRQGAHGGNEHGSLDQAGEGRQDGRGFHE